MENEDLYEEAVHLLRKIANHIGDNDPEAQERLFDFIQTTSDLYKIPWGQVAQDIDEVGDDA